MFVALHVKLEGLWATFFPYPIELKFIEIFFGIGTVLVGYNENSSRKKF